MKNLTPEHIRCQIGFCPSVHELDDGRLLIVGKAAHDAADEGDAPVDHAYGQLVSVGAIGTDETAIIIDRALLANVHAEAIASLQGEVERLKEALKPFAKAADLCEQMRELERYSFSNQELFAARAALSQHPGEGEKAAGGEEATPATSVPKI